MAILTKTEKAGENSSEISTDPLTEVKVRPTDHFRRCSFAKSIEFLPGLC